MFVNRALENSIVIFFGPVTGIKNLLAKCI
jgi:hypothetical protein